MVIDPRQATVAIVSQRIGNARVIEIVICDYFRVIEERPPSRAAIRAEVELFELHDISVLEGVETDRRRSGREPLAIRRLNQSHVVHVVGQGARQCKDCLLYTSPSPRDRTRYRMPSSA